MLQTPSGAVWHGSPARELDSELGEGRRAVAVFRPTAVAVFREPPHGSPRNIVELTVAELDTRGPAVLVRGAEQPGGAPGLAAEVTVDAAAELRLTPGDRVWFSVKAREVVLYPALQGQTGKSS
jgi:molybdate transport system ATP-binding protein